MVWREEALGMLLDQSKQATREAFKQDMAVGVDREDGFKRYLGERI